MKSLNHILKASIPCSKGGLECAPEAKGNLQSSVMEPTAAPTFQYKGVRDFDPLLLAKTTSDEGISPNPLQKESLEQSHVWKGED